MTSLVLLDFESLLEAWRAFARQNALSPNERTSLPIARAGGRCEGWIDADDGGGAVLAPQLPAVVPMRRATAIVVIAVTATVVRDQALTLEYLRRLALRVVDCVQGAPVDAERVACEVVLVMSMSRAVSASLLRMIDEAGSLVSAGPFHDLVLVSSDARLARDITQRMNHERRAPAWTVQRELPSRFRWTCPRGSARRRRAPQLAASSRDALDTAGDATLLEIAAELEIGTAPLGTGPIRPGLLSQVGLTRESARGVGRLGWLPTALRLDLEACAPSDGVVVYHASQSLPQDAAPPPLALVRARVADASIGPGAVTLRYGDKGLTVTRSRLPTCVLRDLVAPAKDQLGLVQLTGRSREIDDDAMLLRGAPGEPLGDPFRVLFTPNGAEIGDATTGWWLLSRRAPRTRLPLPHPVTLPRTQLPRGALALEVSAQLTVSPSGRGLAARCPLGQAVTVAVARTIRRQTIGCAAAAFSDVAVLALDRSIEPTRHLACTPIQAISLPSLVRRARLSPAVVAQLARMPLLIPS